MRSTSSWGSRPTNGSRPGVWWKADPLGSGRTPSGATTVAVTGAARAGSWASTWASSSSQLGTGVDAELLDQCLAHTGIGLEGVDLTATPVEGGDQLGREPLAQRVRGHQLRERPDDLGVAPRCQLGVAQRLLHGEHLLLERRRRRPQPFVVEQVAQHRAPHQPEGAAQQLRRAAVVARLRRLPRRSCDVLEAGGRRPGRRLTSRAYPPPRLTTVSRPRRRRSCDTWAWSELAGLAGWSSPQISSMSRSSETGCGTARASVASSTWSLLPETAIGPVGARTSTGPRT